MQILRYNIVLFFFYHYSLFIVQLPLYVRWISSVLPNEKFVKLQKSAI